MRQLKTLGLLALFVSFASVETGCAAPSSRESVAESEAKLDAEICEAEEAAPAPDLSEAASKDEGYGIYTEVSTAESGTKPDMETPAEETKPETEAPTDSEPVASTPTEIETKHDGDPDDGVRAQSGKLRFLSAPYEGPVELVIDNQGNGKLVTVRTKTAPGGKVVGEVGKIAVRDAKGAWWLVRSAGAELKAAGWSVTKASFRCIGPVGALMLAGQLAYAGMDEALGPSVAAMGGRQQKCADRIAEAAKGVGCLMGQDHKTKCQDAVNACPAAFFGSNLVQSCGDEPSMGPLVEAAAAAIGRTGNLSGGRPASNSEPSVVADAIREGRFAREPDLTCRMRPVTLALSCEMLEGDLMKVEGFSEAKACWDGASRGVTPWSDSKWTTANKCCTTDACRAHIGGLKGC